MGRTLVAFAVLVLAISGFPRAPRVIAQGGNPETDDITFILIIEGRSDPNDIFYVQLGLAAGDTGFELGMAPGGIPFCGNKERQVEQYPSLEYPGPCENGGVYTLKQSSGGDYPIRSYSILRDHVDEVGLIHKYPVSAGSPVVAGGFYSATYNYSAESALPTPPAERPMPEAPPEVGGGGMSERLKPTASPVRWGGGGGSSIAHRR